jgi:alkylation response protein AidB-like acyl-CoA dehydrogenase
MHGVLSTCLLPDAMELAITPDEQRFREEVRGWLADNVPSEGRPPDGLDALAFDKAWQGRLFAAGWAGISWPEEFGGGGCGLVEQLIWHEEYARAKAPYSGFCKPGLTLAGPTIMACGTPEQRERHLSSILKGDALWCQGFSEPGAGSDLASLSTSAVIDGDELVINGSKIWTSYGQFADWQVLLVRTDNQGRKHQGITFVLCDMRSPGIDVRTIRSMVELGHYPFCQVFYDDVRIPLSNVVGAIGDGWRVAGATLGFERGTAFISEQINYVAVVERLIAEASVRPDTAAGATMLANGEIFGKLARLRADLAAMRAMTYWTISHAGEGSPGPEGSLIKLFFAEVLQRTRRLAMDVLGADKLSLSAPSGWTWQYLRSFPATIAAGSMDIQRNIISERLLGLPRNAVQ